MNLALALLQGELGPLLASVLVIGVFALIAGVVANDARQRGMEPASAWGFGMFVLLMAGAVIGDWAGAVVAGLVGVALYLRVRE